MEDKAFEALLESVRWMGKHRRGETRKGRTAKVIEPEVKVLREATQLSQAQFARLIGVSLRTLQNWEQKRSRPTGAARALLRIVAADPEAAIRALHRAA